MCSHCNVWEQRSDLPLSPYETFSSYLLWWWCGTANLYFSASAHPIVHRGSWEMLPVSSRTSLHFLSILKDLISAELPWQQSLAHLAQPLLSHSLGCSLALSRTNKALMRCILFFQKLLSVLRFLPTELPFLRTDLTGGTHYLSLLQLLVWASVHAQTCLWLCIRFSGITQGGKHRLIKSSSSPWWMPLSIHCCLLIAVTQRGASSLIQFKVYAKESYSRVWFTPPAVMTPLDDSHLVKSLGETPLSICWC